MKKFKVLLIDRNRYNNNCWEMEINANSVSEARKIAKKYAKEEKLFFDSIYETTKDGNIRCFPTNI